MTVPVRDKLPEQLHRAEILLWVEERVLENLAPDARPSVTTDVEERVGKLEAAVLELSGRLALRDAWPGQNVAEANGARLGRVGDLSDNALRLDVGPPRHTKHFWIGADQIGAVTTESVSLRADAGAVASMRRSPRRKPASRASRRTQCRA